MSAGCSCASDLLIRFGVSRCNGRLLARQVITAGRRAGSTVSPLPVRAHPSLSKESRANGVTNLHIRLASELSGAKCRAQVVKNKINAYAAGDTPRQLIVGPQPLNVESRLPRESSRFSYVEGYEF